MKESKASELDSIHCEHCRQDTESCDGIQGQDRADIKQLFLDIAKKVTDVDGLIDFRNIEKRINKL